MTEEKQNLNRKGRFQLLFIAAVFLGPLIAAWWLYDPAGGWTPGGSSANGELIGPFKLVSDEILALPPEQRSSPYIGHWTFIHVGDGQCIDSCRVALFKSRQVRRALGKERDRVSRLFFSTNGLPLDSDVAAEHQDLQQFATDDPISLELSAVLPAAASGSIYLADPLGNLMMRFEPDTGMKFIHKDLKKLLKVSSIG